MKKSLVAVVVFLAAIAAAQTSQPANPGQQGATAQSSSPSAQPVIKDPAEYNAYMSAIQQQDVNAKISGLEAFLTQYPNSVVKMDALELLMATYQQSGNQAKTLETAQRVLQADPNNVRALALLTYTLRAKAQQNGPDAAQDWQQAKDYATRGLQALQTFQKPQGTTDEAFDKLKATMANIFNSTIGLASFQQKDYPTTIKELRPLVDANPNDFTTVYQLALSYLQSAPPDYINGIWYAIRASAVAPAPQYKQSIQKYAESQYDKYHGGDDGWTDLLAQASATPTPPAGFTIKPAPTPSEQAHNLVQGKTPDEIKAMSFADWEMVLSAGQQADSDQVWNVIKGLSLQMEGVVISATPTQLQIAESQDDIDQKRADIILTMVAPIPARLMPKEGATLDFAGVPESFTPSPFVITMDQGTLLTKAAPEKKKAPVHRRRPTK
jgi:tetratricopeptide (TPR) repeat protein